MSRKNIEEAMKKNVSNDPGGILASLWRSILIKDKFLPVVNFLIAEYARKNKGKKVKNPSTVMGLVTAPSMTWKSFIFLLTKILPVKNITITIELEYLSNKKGIHTISIPIDRNKEDKDLAEGLDVLTSNIYGIINKDKKEDKDKDEGNNESNSS